MSLTDAGNDTQALSGQTLILLPGWALGPEPLMPLVRALRKRLPDVEICCHPLPDLASHRPESWVAVLDRELPPDAWLAGWSLGGMLAAALVHWRGHQSLGLITLGANASFVARPAWNSGLAAEQVDRFRLGLHSAPTTTLAQFARLSAQGGRDARRLSRTLLGALRSTPVDRAAAGLGVLTALDLCETLPRLRVPQLHLFAENDLLVPFSARAAIAASLPPTGRTECLADAGHAFPISHVAQTTDRMAAFVLETRNRAPRHERHGGSHGDRYGDRPVVGHEVRGT